ncbi:MAG: hypothetical protein J6P44_09305 [Bacteroidales bacterium]|nr:hypothetical protein [Bacteroidales bacterium]
MKRILVLTLALCVAAGLNAQIIQSDSEQIIVTVKEKPKKEKKKKEPTAFTWYAKGGIAIMHIEHGVGEASDKVVPTNETKIGYDLKIGFLKPFNNK